MKQSMAPTRTERGIASLRSQWRELAGGLPEDKKSRPRARRGNRSEANGSATKRDVERAAPLAVQAGWWP
jgi:hypothetical protein